MGFKKRYIDSSSCWLWRLPQWVDFHLKFRLIEQLAKHIRPLGWDVNVNCETEHVNWQLPTGKEAKNLY